MLLQNSTILDRSHFKIYHKHVKEEAVINIQRLHNSLKCCFSKLNISREYICGENVPLEQWSVMCYLLIDTPFDQIDGNANPCIVASLFQVKRWSLESKTCERGRLKQETLW